MPAWNHELQGEQLTIAAHNGHPMRVVAGPGTGKSFGLKRKVQRLLEEGKDAKAILAVTFTNVAADSLKEDLQTQLAAEGIPGAENLVACTLHSLCFSILQKQQVLRITGRNARPLMDFEKDIFVEDLKSSHGGKDATFELIGAYESAFAREQTDTAGVITSPADLRFKEDLLKWLKFHRAMLIGEVIPLAISYLKNHPEAPERGQFKYILVDEYQDLNKAEQTLIHLLKGDDAEIVIVGDEDQSIYRFKNAHPEGIADFANQHSELADVSLTVCRRCPKKVVRLANEFMQYPLERPHKVLSEFGANDEGVIDLVRWEDVSGETNGIAKFITHLVDGATVKPKDFLVLSPREKLANFLKERLRALNVKAHTFFKEDVLNSSEAAKRFALLSYLVDPEDRVALRALLAMPTVLEGQYKKIQDKALELSKSAKEILQMLQANEIDIPRTRELKQRFSTIEEETIRLSQLSIPQLIEWFCEDVEGLSKISELCEGLDVTTIPNTAELLKVVREKILFPEADEDKDYVRIMSLHKSKGLSAPYVIILGCCDGFIPTIKDEEKLRERNELEEIEKRKAEAKRLFFVAITRAKKQLIFSSFNKAEQSIALSLGGLKPRRKEFDRRTRVTMFYTKATEFFDAMAGNLPSAITGDQFLATYVPNS